jgi:antitoxin component of MazEF toxin-antitoxin module
MSRLFTILLCVAALGVVVFLCIYEPLTTSTREQREATSAGLVLPLDPSGVKEIRLSSSGEEVEIKRRGDDWILESKPKDRADKATVEQLIQAAAQLAFIDRIDGSEFKKGRDLNDFGLKNPKRKIEFRGDQNVTLFIGKDAANEDRLYAKTNGSNDVYLVLDDILDVAFPETGKFRDRRLTDLQVDQMDRLIVRQPTGEVEFARDARGWRMVKPLNAPVDGRAMDAYLDKLLGLRIQEFVADDSGDLGAYGIAEGKNEISFLAEGSSRPQTLRLGSDKDGGVLAQFTGRDSIYRLGKEVKDLLAVSPDSFRDRRLLPLNLDLVDLIRISSPQGNFSLRRSGENWEVVDSEGTHPASNAALQSLVDTLATTQVVSYTSAVGEKLAGFGLTAPVLTVDFLSVLSENTPEASAGERSIARLSFGRTEGEQIFVRNDDLPEVETVPAKVLLSIPADPKAWQIPR